MIKFRMCKIQVTQFAILQEILSDKQLGFEMVTNIRYSIPNKVIALETIFSFSAKDNVRCMQLGVQCDFTIHPDDWQQCKKENIVTIPKNAMDYLLAQTVGTARGVLHCKTEGTPYNGFVLPPLDVSGVVKEDIKISLS